MDVQRMIQANDEHARSVSNLYHSVTVVARNATFGLIAVVLPQIVVRLSTGSPVDLQVILVLLAITQSYELHVSMDTIDKRNADAFTKRK